MFGYVSANWSELTKDQKDRYQTVYCGICRALRKQCSTAAGACLSYDMVFLALLLMSLYEPEERGGDQFCVLHPLHARPWTESRAVSYAADMNAALAYYQALDDAADDASLKGRLAAGILKPGLTWITAAWPRQCAAMADCIRELTDMERSGETNPDLPAACFGRLMAELMVLQEDLWQEPLRELGFHLGRFIYLADAMMDYEQDRKKGSYNPFLAAGIPRDPEQWENYLVLTLARCTQAYEKLPLVQDKALLDNILYSGVWVHRGNRRKEKRHGSGSVEGTGREQGCRR